MDRAKWELLQALVCLVLPLIMLAVYLLWIFAYLVARILGLEPPAGRFAQLFAILPPSLGGPLGFTRPPPDATAPPPPIAIEVRELPHHMRIELLPDQENSTAWVVWPGTAPDPLIALSPDPESSIAEVTDIGGLEVGAIPLEAMVIPTTGDWKIEVADSASVQEYAEGLGEVAEDGVEAVLSAGAFFEQARTPVAVALTERFDDLRCEFTKWEVVSGLYGADFSEGYDGDTLELLLEVVDEFVENVTSVEWWVDTLMSDFFVGALVGTAAISLLESLLKEKADREKKRGKHREAAVLDDMSGECGAVRKFFEKLWNDLHVSKAMAVQIEENTGIPRKRLGEILRCFADHTPPCYWQLRGLIMSQESD